MRQSGAMHADEDVRVPRQRQLLEERHPMVVVDGRSVTFATFGGPRTKLVEGRRIGSARPKSAGRPILVEPS